MSARYRALALEPVSSATTPAALRGWAPAFTSRRSASTAAGSPAPASGVGRRADHEHDLALRRRARVALGELRCAAADDLLVRLRQLAADRDLAFRVELREQRERARHAPRRLEGHERPAGLGEHAPQLPLLARQEALEAPLVGGQPGGDERRDRSRRPRQHLDRKPGRDAGAHQHVARVRDERHPGVRHERHHSPIAHAPDELGGARLLVVLVVRHELGLDAVAVEQDARATRVLAGDDVRLAQRRQHAQRHVLEIADRRRADDEPPAHAVASASVIEGEQGGAHHPRLVAEVGGADRDPGAHRRHRALGDDAARAGSSSSSPARTAPPPITITSGLKTLTTPTSP